MDQNRPDEKKKQKIENEAASMFRVNNQYRVRLILSTGRSSSP